MSLTLPVPPVRQPPVPPLEPGDRLTRDEFARRYRAMPRLKKAELLEGVVHMPSPVRWEHHGAPNADLIWWLGSYRMLTPGVRVGDNTSIRLDRENEPQPDGVLLVLPEYGGNVRLDEDGIVEGSPELVAEVASSSASIDLGVKQRIYRKNGIREYLVWRVLDGVLDWFVLRGSDYEPLQAGPDGLLRSDRFPGLWLDAPALLRGDLAAVLDALRRGTATPEHASFAARLLRAFATRHPSRPAEAQRAAPWTEQSPE